MVDFALSAHAVTWKLGGTEGAVTVVLTGTLGPIRWRLLSIPVSLVSSDR